MIFSGLVDMFSWQNFKYLEPDKKGSIRLQFDKSIVPLMQN